MDRQVSPNDAINATRCCCVPSVKCMHRFEFDRWEKVREESPKKKNSLFKTIYRIKGFHDRTGRFINTAKYYRNNISCFPEQIISSLVKLRVKSACRQLMSRGERTYTKADYWLALRWAEVRKLYYLIVLTRWHIYSSGVHAKLIWHGAGDSQVRSGHDFDPVCYPSVGKGTLVQLNEKRNGRSKACTSDFSAELKKNYFRECERCVLNR